MIKVLQQQKELKNITIMCIGTRGDFQPYLALAVELKSVGYNVRLLSTITFRKFAEDYGIEFVVITDHCIDKRLREDDFLKEAMAHGDLTKMIEKGPEISLDDLPYRIEKFHQEMCDHTPDLFIQGTLCEYFGLYVERILKLPSIEVKLQAVVYNPDRAMMGLPTLPNGGHYQIHLKLYEGMYQNWEENYDNITESLGRQKLSSVYPKELFMKDSEKKLNGETDMIVCQSTLFKKILAPNSSKSLSFVGPLIVEPKDQSEISNSFGGVDVDQTIKAFLRAVPNSKPVYCGWGSMVYKSPQHMIRFVVSSLKMSGERGIVLGGVAGLSFELLKQSTMDKELIAYAEKNILFVEKVSHENLFHHVKCIVHHGGAGTTNAALRSGVPNVITPVFFDQYDHAHVINELGVGFGFSTQIQKITSEELGMAIQNVVNNEDTKRRASEIAERIREENGQKEVLSKIQEYWTKHCKFNFQTIQKVSSTKARRAVSA